MSTIQLPVEFVKRMEHLLQDEASAFFHALQQQQVHGLRVNTLKISVDTFSALSPFPLSPIPWTDIGYYYPATVRPGKHPYHEAGLYYIQEPSAMAVVELMDPQPGEKILDISAAPGGKATHIAQYMQQQGLLIANEIHPARAKVLAQNVERLGIRHAIVTNEHPKHLTQHFPHFFDRILVDAPCSGEGMFRKNILACEEWSMKHVQMCATRQQQILTAAKKMLRNGGRLVYSTCTFAPEENEQVIQQFIKHNPEFEIEKIKHYEKFNSGRTDWVTHPCSEINHTIRLWPHKIEGEGHFIALLRYSDKDVKQQLKPLQATANHKELEQFNQFIKEYVNTPIEGPFTLFGNELYQVPPSMINMDKLKVVRPGWHLGTNKKKRFKPSHAFALGLHKDQVQNHFDTSSHSEELFSFLRGETFQTTGVNGWYLITVDGYSIGWGKLSKSTMKNHFPKGRKWHSNNVESILLR